MSHRIFGDGLTKMGLAENFAYPDITKLAT